MANNLHLVGALAGKSLQLQNYTSLTYHERIGDVSTGSSMRVYNDEAYVECTVEPTGSAQDSGF